MKKLTLGALALFLFAAGCKKPLTPSTEKEPAEEVQAITQRKCAADEVLQAQLQEDPTLGERMRQIEAFTQKAIRSGVTARLAADGAIEIPVVVHVLWNTTAQDIDDAQVQSQIAVLNEDFQNKNSDGSQLPAGFKSVASLGMNIRFVLAQPPLHKYTRVKSFSTNDAMKSSKRGGSDAVDPANNLNLWSCNMSGGVLGYAQFPGGNPDTDGVVILYSAVGSRAKYKDGTYVSKYDLGRTGTHEVGHWLNLRHIWGDDSGACSGSDLVGDTPNQGGANYGCPSFPKVSCSNSPNGDMFMNYMDYTDDACMYMYSAGQVNRALAVFAANGPRAAMGQ
jgi:hypothetical protein